MECISKIDFSRLNSNQQKIYFVNHVIDCLGDVVKACDDLGISYSKYERWLNSQRFRDKMSLVDISIAYRAQADIVRQSQNGSVIATKEILKQKGHLIDWDFDPLNKPSEGDKGFDKDFDSEVRCNVNRKILDMDSRRAAI